MTKKTLTAEVREIMTTLSNIGGEIEAPECSTPGTVVATVNRLWRFEFVNGEFFTRTRRDGKLVIGIRNQ